MTTSIEPCESMSEMMTQEVQESVDGGSRAMPGCVDELVSLSVRALEQMYRSDQGCYGYCVRRTTEGDRIEGVSRRYTAISLIGLAAAIQDEHGDQVRKLLAGSSSADASVPMEALGGESLLDVTGRLLREVETVTNLGDVALTLWAAQAVGHEDAELALLCLLALKPWEANCPTVELAWAVTALTHQSSAGNQDPVVLDRTAQRLMDSFVSASKLFPHWPTGATPARFRGHVCCFADLVYPTQALAIYYAHSKDERAASIARQCGQQMVDLQGPDGQWWWHFDSRNGRVIEGYPVYAVHQDSMAPMALLDLQDACGVDHMAAIERGLAWLYHPTECNEKLVDSKKGLVWRKVARREPNKLSRTVNALLSAIHPSLRLWGIQTVFRPGWVDWESRPYHFGWVLYAWCNRQFQR